MAYNIGVPPLGVTRGGTGTTTAFTAGSVLFAGASGVYTQDNSSFFFDNTNNRLGLGTTSPSSYFHIAQTGTTVDTLCTLQGQKTTMRVVSNNDNPQLIFQRTGGTAGTFGEVQIGIDFTDVGSGTLTNVVRVLTDFGVSGSAGITGNLTVTGSVSKGSGSFRIDHPVDPLNKFLYHSFVECPEMLNIYNGNVVLDADGKAVITMPAWFKPLNKDFKYQLTCIGGYAPVYINKECDGETFSIAGGVEGLKVSWQITGVRQDKFALANPIQVEVDKETPHYIHPELHKDQ